MILTLQVPLPPRDCSSNGAKGSWRKKATATREYRIETFAALRAAWGWKLDGTVITPVRMSLVFCTKGSRGTGRYAPRDLSNALSSFKAAQDEIAQNLGIDDDHKHMKLGEISIDNTRGPYVIVTIEPASEPLARRNPENPDELATAEVRTPETGVDA
jgi:hypothetical protein